MHRENRTCKRKDVYIANNNMIGQYKLYEHSIKPLAAKNGLSFSVLCIAPFL